MNIGRSINVSLALHGDKGMKKKDLAEALGVSLNTVSTLSNNKHCTGFMAERLADVFGVSSSEFIRRGE